MPRYCLFCKTGREAAVEAALAEAGCRVIGTRAVSNEVRRGGALVPLVRPLLPGYVFLESEAEPDWKALRRRGGALRPLAYGDGRTALRGADLEFVSLFARYGGLLGVSRAAQVGGRIRIIDGPLKAYEGRILRLNRRRLSAEVRIEGEGISCAVWLPYEVIEKIERIEKIETARSG